MSLFVILIKGEIKFIHFRVFYKFWLNFLNKKNIMALLDN